MSISIKQLSDLAIEKANGSQDWWLRIDGDGWSAVNKQQIQEMKDILLKSNCKAILAFESNSSTEDCLELKECIHQIQDVMGKDFEDKKVSIKITNLYKVE